MDTTRTRHRPPQTYRDKAEAAAGAAEEVDRMGRKASRNCVWHPASGISLSWPNLSGGPALNLEIPDLEAKDAKEAAYVAAGGDLTKLRARTNMTDEAPKPNLFGNPVVAGVFVLVAIGLWKADAIIEAYRRPVVIPDVSPTPVSNFPALVRATFQGTEQEKQTLAGVFKARLALLDSDAKFDTTETFHDVTSSADKMRFGMSRYDNGKLSPFWQLAFEEATRRGLVAPDEDGNGRPDKPILLDRSGYQRFYGDILEGLQ